MKKITFSPFVHRKNPTVLLYFFLFIALSCLTACGEAKSDNSDSETTSEKNDLKKKPLDEAKIASLSPEAQQYIGIIKHHLESANKSHVAQKSIVTKGYTAEFFALLLDTQDQHQLRRAAMGRDQSPEKVEELEKKGLKQAEEMRHYLSSQGIKKIHYVDEKTQKIVTYDPSKKNVTITNEKTGEETIYKIYLQTVKENQQKARNGSLWRSRKMMFPST